MDREPLDTQGISRRSLLKRGAVVSGSLIWAAPTIQSLAQPAFAQEASPACAFDVFFTDPVTGECLDPPGVVGRCSAALECCECLQAGGADCDTACEALDCTFFDDPRPCP